MDKDGERFPPLFPLKKSELGGDLGGADGAVVLPAALVGEEEGKKGRVGKRGRRGPRTLALSRQHAWRDRVATSSPTRRSLSRHMHWRDRGYLSRQGKWRDQTGYSLEIKTNTG